MSIIIQHGVGDCAELLRLTNRRHSEYAARHGHKLIQDYGRRCPERPMYWEKIPLLLETLRGLAGGVCIAYLDADTLIVDMKTDLFDGFSAGVAMSVVRYPRTPPHFNTGVMLLRNGEKIRRMLEDAFERYPNPAPANIHPKHDEKAINEALQAAPDIRAVELPPRFNSWHHNPASEPVIAAWHGTPNETVRKRIKAELAA